MRRLLVLIFSTMMFSITQADSLPLCDTPNIPKAVKKLEDYDIIATNTAKIPTAQSFTGTELIYQIHYHVKNLQNKVHIDAKTGVITIVAEKKDQFDINVTAKNACGSATAKFNVIIDEEE